MSEPIPQPLIEVSGLSRHFTVRDAAGKKHTIRAVDDVSLTIARGECLGVVGESGSGKSTLGRCILQLDRPSSGVVRVAGTDITALSGRERKPFQRRMQVIYQDPYSSLSPTRTALQQVTEPLRVLTNTPNPDAVAAAMLERVGIPERMLQRPPSAFSGGQRQRIAIARALVVNPEFLLCDEPVSALDVSIQAQITQLLLTMQRELQLTYLFISHDLAVVREIATRTAVMYQGQIVELGATADIFNDPQHPYTQRLLDAVLVPDPTMARERLAHIGANPLPPVSVDREAPLREVAPGHFVRSAVAPR